MSKNEIRKTVVVLIALIGALLTGVFYRAIIDTIGVEGTILVIVVASVVALAAVCVPEEEED